MPTDRRSFSRLKDDHNILEVPTGHGAGVASGKSPNDIKYLTWEAIVSNNNSPKLKKIVRNRV